MIATVGVATCFALNAVSFLAVLASLLLMRERELFGVARAEEHPTLAKGMREGLGVRLAVPAVRTVLLITTVVSTVGFNFHVLVPVLASETLAAVRRSFGILSAASGSARWPGRCSTAALASASWKALLAGSAASARPARARSAADAARRRRTAVRHRRLLHGLDGEQPVDPPARRARPPARPGASLYFFAFAGLAPLGGLLAGLLSEVGGTQLAFFVAGIACLAMTAYAFIAWPRNANQEVSADSAEQRLAA